MYGLDKRKRKIYFIVIGLLVLFAFVVYLMSSAIKRDKEQRFDKKYQLMQYNNDKYDGKVEYDTQGVIPEAVDDNAGTESTDWGEGTGIFESYTDESGNVLWKGVSESEYEHMSDSEKVEIEKEYADVEKKIMGDSNNTDMTEDTPIEQTLYNGTVYENIASLCMDYNEAIPFSYGGRSYEIGFNLQKEGYDNSIYPVGSGYGLDGPGYLIWLYRNAIGYTPDELKGGVTSNKLKEQEIAYSDIQVGDICATSIKDTDITYGVVAGFSDGNPVVSVCTNDASVLFPYGCNHLVYIKADKDELLGNYSPIDFSVFYRLDELTEDK